MVIMSLEQRQIEFEPSITLNHNIYQYMLGRAMRLIIELEWLPLNQRIKDGLIFHNPTPHSQAMHDIGRQKLRGATQGSKVPETMF